MVRWKRQLSRLRLFAFVLVAAGALGGCGQTGALYLPRHKPPPRQAKPAPVPATAAQAVPAAATR